MKNLGIINSMKYILSLVVISMCLFSFVLPTFAQGNQGTIGNNGNQGTVGDNSNQGTIDNRNNPDNIIKLKNPLKGNESDLYGFIKLVVNNVLIPVGGVVAVLYIMYSGFLMVTAQGNTTQIEKAKKGFFYAVIGTAVLLGAWVITEGIVSTIDQITK